MTDKNEMNLAKAVVLIRMQIQDNKRYNYGHNSTGAGGVIYDQKNNKLLVVKGPVKWSLPKGHRETGEEPHETAMREILEETSIKVELNVKSKFKRVMKCIYYFVRIDDGDKLNVRWIDSSEVCDIKWYTREQLKCMSCNKQLMQFIDRWDNLVYTFRKYGDKVNYPFTLPNNNEFEQLKVEFLDTH
jgi:8-oxo-dGTP pyrophosphatase MutT (NUDIX family)